MRMKCFRGVQGADCSPHRHATCAGRRKSSVTGKCPSARTASITRQIVCSHKSRRNGIRQRGMYSVCCRSLCSISLTGLLLYSAKYIEGLENRLGRMESLLRLSGLLSEDDGGKTDLGTLEKRLADRSLANGGISRPKSPNKFTAPQSNAQSQPTTSSHHSTPRVESQSSPRTAATSPESQKESETEVEGLSDMMCSLVTNNCGETRYIGECFWMIPAWAGINK